MDNLHQWERAFTHVTVHFPGNKTPTFDLTGIRLYQQFLDRLRQAAAPDQALFLAGCIDEVIDREHDPLPRQLAQSFRLSSEHDFDVFQQVVQHAHAFATREVNFIFHVRILPAVLSTPGPISRLTFLNIVSCVRRPAASTDRLSAWPKPALA